MQGKRVAPSSPAVDGQDDARMMGLGVHSRHMPMMFEHSAIHKNFWPPVLQSIAMTRMTPG